MSFAYDVLNMYVFKADLNESCEDMQVTLDGSAFQTVAAAWTNVQLPALLRDVGTTRVLASAQRIHLAGLQMNTSLCV